MQIKKDKTKSTKKDLKSPVCPWRPPIWTMGMRNKVFLEWNHLMRLILMECHLYEDWTQAATLPLHICSQHTGCFRIRTTQILGHKFSENWRNKCIPIWCHKAEKVTCWKSSTFWLQFRGNYSYTYWIQRYFHLISRLFLPVPPTLS